jgi:methyl-CpG-binding domain protein 4
MDIIQNQYRDNPWKMCIACILLNQTTNVQVRPILKNLFEKFPIPQKMIDAKDQEIIDIIRSAGLYNRRTATIKRFSKEYIRQSHNHISELHGIGRYASDSYEIFINGNLNISPTDKVLIKYLKLLKKQ